MGSGGTEGKYIISKDTVKLIYKDKPSEDWPDIMLIRKEYFISKDSLEIKKQLKITRTK
jgi:hypothetical protein